jgi:hypothetical protein
MRENKDLEQFQEKCEAVFRPGLRKNKEYRAVRCFREKLNRAKARRANLKDCDAL